jgi:hypothetical protein
MRFVLTETYRNSVWILAVAEAKRKSNVMTASCLRSRRPDLPPKVVGQVNDLLARLKCDSRVAVQPAGEPPNSIHAAASEYHSTVAQQGVQAGVKTKTWQIPDGFAAGDCRMYKGKITIKIRRNGPFR